MKVFSAFRLFICVALASTCVHAQELVSSPQRLELIPSGAASLVIGNAGQAVESTQPVDLSSRRPENLTRSPELGAPLYGRIKFGSFTYLIGLDASQLTRPPAPPTLSLNSVSPLYSGLSVTLWPTRFCLETWTSSSREYVLAYGKHETEKNEPNDDGPTNRARQEARGPAAEIHHRTHNPDHT